MLSISITPRVVRHGSFYRNVTKFYAIDICYRSHIFERHLFTNKREYLSMCSSLSDIMPLYSSHTGGLCYDVYYAIDISFLDLFSNID